MTADIHNRILRACYSVLLPIVRALLTAGISYREFDKLIRVAYVRVASADYGLRGRPTNHSRISAMTGIPRKEVSKIRAESANLEQLPREELTPLGDILHRWHTDPAFLDASGRPIPLRLVGTSPSFEELTRASSGDLPTGAIKVELLRIGAIRQNADGALSVVRREAVPQAFDERLITSFSFNLACLASTIAYNSNPQRKAKSRIERFVQSDDLSEAAKAHLRQITQERIRQFTFEIDDMFTTAEPSDGDCFGRIGVGVYYYEDD